MLEASSNHTTVVVTGGSRGIGKGVAETLASSGYRVFATGRTVDRTQFKNPVTAIVADHADDEQTQAVFDTVRAEAGSLEILVHCAWGGYECMVEDGRFTWMDPFWQQPAWRWSAMVDIGVRAGFVASQHAARMMVPAGRGLIVHLSYWAARKFMGNTIYGISKAATDKMVADTAAELSGTGVAVVSLYPGLVRTEAVVESGAFDLCNSESPEFIGRVIAALHADADHHKLTGETHVAAELARRYSVTDIDGKQPRPLDLYTC